MAIASSGTRTYMRTPRSCSEHSCDLTVHHNTRALCRAVADQIDGSEQRHMVYRKLTCDFMEEHVDDFAPFIDGDFSQYLSRMRRDGVWGGNPEIVAICRRFNCHTTVFQHRAPCLEVKNYDNPNADTINISYHSGEHYCSIRLENDDTDQPAKTIKIHATRNNSTTKTDSTSRAEHIVIQSTGCRNLEHVQQILRENWNDVDATVEILMAEKQMGTDWDSIKYTHTSSILRPPKDSDHESTTSAQLHENSETTSRPKSTAEQKSSSKSAALQKKMTNRERKAKKKEKKEKKRRDKQNTKLKDESDQRDEDDLVHNFGSVCI